MKIWKFFHRIVQKVSFYEVYTLMHLLIVRAPKYIHCKKRLAVVGIRIPPRPLSRKRVCHCVTPPPPEPKGWWRDTLACESAGEGWGSPNSDDGRKSLVLCLLCGSRYI